MSKNVKVLHRFNDTGVPISVPFVLYYILKYFCFQDDLLTITIKFDNETSMRLKKTASVGELKLLFCERTNLSYASVRLFFDGERLQDESILDFLRDGDLVEAFEGCDGGGPPKKKSKAFNDDQIKAALYKSSEDSDSDVNANEETFKKENMCDSETWKQKHTDMSKGENNEENVNAVNSKESKENRDCENTENITAKDENMNVVSNTVPIEDHEEIKGAKLKDDLWLEELREKNSNGKLEGSSSLHLQLKFYLSLPSLAEAEKKIVKNHI